MSINHFIRHAALGRRIVATVPPINLTAWADLARLASNLNQITKAMHGGNFAAARLLPSTVAQLADQVSDLRLALIANHDEEEES